MPTDIIIAVFASGGFWAFIQFLISRRDTTQKQLHDLDNKLEELSEKIDENSAVLARTHILRFSDELMNGIDHSSMYFKQTLDDVDTYSQYCDKHPLFKNSYTELASEHIKATYKKLVAKGEFSMDKGDTNHEQD